MVTVTRRTGLGAGAEASFPSTPGGEVWPARGGKRDHASDGAGLSVELIDPVKGLPDLVFTANCGLVYEKLFISSRFRYGVRICPEPVHWGGLSGCTYTEGVSWGKFLSREEGGQYAEVHCDATIAWPAGREQVDVGTLTLDRVESEESSAASDINFDPSVLPAGIAPSDDPLLSARSAVYSQSFTRRAGETKQPSAITPAEVRKGD